MTLHERTMFGCALGNDVLERTLLIVQGSIQYLHLCLRNPTEFRDITFNLRDPLLSAFRFFQNNIFELIVDWKQTTPTTSLRGIPFPKKRTKPRLNPAVSSS